MSRNPSEITEKLLRSPSPQVPPLCFILSYFFGFPFALLNANLCTIPTEGYLRLRPMGCIRHAYDGFADFSYDGIF